MNKIKAFFTRDNFKHIFSSNGANHLYSSLICVAFGLLLGFIIMLCLSPDIAGTDFLMLITGGLVYYGSEGFGNILATLAPLLCCGVAIIFAYKTGIFNIGAAGQYTLGAFGALLFAILFKCHWTVCLLMAIIFGALWGVIPALLKTFCHVNEVISGIMLNWIGLFFVNYSMQTYAKGMVDSGDSFQTYQFWLSSSGDAYNPLGKLPNLGATSLGDCFSIAIFIAIIVAIIAFIVMEKTTFGYQLKASGYNRSATKYAGINAKKNAILTMAISGGIAGLGAGLYYLSGIERWSAVSSSILPQVPWNGIIIAFIAQMNPIGAIFASGFLSLLSIGATATSQSVFPKEIADLITSIIVYASGLTAITLRIVPWIKNKIQLKKTGGVKELPLNKEGK
ncbi:MAG: ABC transporter permease [Bacilli bacterium]|nr:ABC transporter permease [Bacilli bacterium]